MAEQETYERPKYGWTCFHCGETFTTVGSAQDHFGASPDREPGCLIRVKYGNERGLEMELRKAEQREEKLREELRLAETRIEGMEYRLLGWEAIAPSTHQLRMDMDSMRGREITANALIEGIRNRIDPKLFAEIIG